VTALTKIAADVSQALLSMSLSERLAHLRERSFGLIDRLMRHWAFRQLLCP